jgi:hypothetical protein
MAAITQFPAQCGVDADFTKLPQRRPFKTVVRLSAYLAQYLLRPGFHAIQKEKKKKTRNF